jgi:nitroreductase
MDPVASDLSPEQANVLLELVTSRRSASTLGAPGPTDAELAKMLAAAASAPDHGQLRPYRFAVISGDGRLQFGAALAAGARERKPELSEAALEATAAKALRSPTIVAVIASPKPGKIEVWEQTVTAACAGYAIILAAHALGVGAVWKSVPFTRGKALAELFGMSPAEEVLGWIHMGTKTKDAVAVRAPLDLAAVTTVFDGSSPRPFQP